MKEKEPFSKLGLLKTIVSKLDEALKDAANGDYWNEDRCCASINYKGYSITAWITNHDAEAEVCYNGNRESLHDHSNIEEYIASYVTLLCDIDIEEPDDEWNEHGFSSYQDYLNYRYG